MDCIVALCLILTSPSEGEWRLDAFATTPPPSFAKVVERQRTVFYGRAYIINFQDKIGDGEPLTFTFRRTGPKIAGKLYVGVRRQF